MEALIEVQLPEQRQTLSLKVVRANSTQNSQFEMQCRQLSCMLESSRKEVSDITWQIHRKKAGVMNCLKLLTI
jgi:uncharacterized protein (DUF2344 family)